MKSLQLSMFSWSRADDLTLDVIHPADVEPPVPTLARAPMPAELRELARHLERCRFLPGSWDKRFVRDMAALARSEAPEITERQRACLERLGHRYRRQLRRFTTGADDHRVAPAGVSEVRWSDYNRKMNELLMGRARA